jgi:hypothetical protein
LQIRNLVKQRFAESVVFTGMTAMPVSNAKAQATRGIVVARPRASDTIGDALRDAFARDSALPLDMVGLLRKLDGQQRA